MMSRKRAWTVLAVVGVGFGLASDAGAQWVRADVGWCDEDWGGSETDRYCMALEADFSDPGRMVIDGGMNGGVHVEGGPGIGSKYVLRSGQTLRRRSVRRRSRTRSKSAWMVGA